MKVTAEAPQALEWPEGIPDPPDPDEDGSVTLPKEVAEAVVQRLAHYEVMPRLCQASIDTTKRIAEAELDAAIRRCRADQLEQSAEAGVVAADRWPTWLVAILVGGGVAVGLGTGVAVGLILAD